MTTKAVLSFFIACGAFFAGAGLAMAQSAPVEGAAIREVLSISWQPGYCAARARSRGCVDFSATSQAARQFSLVSRFQVRKSYCGIEARLQQRARKGKWIDLPEIVLASGTKDRLAAAMPAARVGLDRQQWLRSGSCVAASPEIYYSRTLDLLDQINASPVRALFTGKGGGTVTLAEVRAAFDTAFGAGSGERVRLSCRKVGERSVVIGLTIGISAGGDKLPALISAATPTKSRCTGGVTGAENAGLQSQVR